jgi:hypothetical protein
VTTTIDEDNGKTTLTFFVNVMSELAKLNNFNGMAALYSGIVRSHTSKKMIQSMSIQHRRIYENAEQLFSDKSNYRRYRETIRSSGLACIPYVGLFFRDLKKLKVELMVGCQISFERCVELAQLVEDFTKHQLPYSQLNFADTDLTYQLNQAIPCVQKWLNNLVDEKKEYISNEQQYTLVLESLIARFMMIVKDDEHSPSWMKVRNL